MSYFQNKVIWVTGASSGIGYETVIALAKRGAKSIIVSGRNESNLTALAKKVPGVNVLKLAFDVTNCQQNHQAFKEIERIYGRLDIIFLNAGGAGDYDSNHFNSHEFIEVMKLNYFSLLYGVEAALPLLKQSKSAQIIGMSSVASYHGLPGSAGYCAAKAAARIFLQGLAMDLRPTVAVSIVCPGFVKTPLTDRHQRRLPFLLSAAKAAKIIVRGIEKQQLEIHFPRRLCWLFSAICCLPRKMTQYLLQRVA